MMKELKKMKYNQKHIYATVEWNRPLSLKPVEII